MPRPWLTTESIDRAVRERDVEWLANLIHQGDDLTPEVRKYLAGVIADLLKGKRKFPRHRPKKKGLIWEKHKIQVKIWEAIKSQGKPLPMRYANGKSVLIRGQHSLKVAVAAVAKELKCSQTTVWNAWAGFDPWGYELQQEKYAYDAMMDSYYEFRADTALESLQREFGNRAEFTDEEIEARAEELDESLRDELED
jgi:hypothetical protein